MQIDIDAQFGEAVRARRVEKGVSQKWVAEQMAEAGITTDGPSISRLEKGNRTVRLAEAVVLADVLDMSLEDLVFEANPRRALESLRYSANSAMRRVETYSGVWAEALLEVKAFIARRPELISVLHDPEGEPLDAADNYLNWVLKRVERLAQESRTDPDLAPAIDISMTDSEVEQLRAILHAHADLVLVRTANDSAET